MISVTSAAQISVPSCPPAPPKPVEKPAVGVGKSGENWMPDAERRAFFIDMRVMLRSCLGANKNERVTIVILACIEAGINRGSRIVAVAKQLDFHPQHAGNILNQGLKAKLWHRSDEGIYSLPA
jgi:hypothetical protein